MKVGTRSFRAPALGILLIVLSCLALPVCTEAQGIMAAHSKEYKSTDVPKEIPGKGTETSTLTIADAGPIVDLNVKLNITHPYNADLDVYLIAPDGTRVELFTDAGSTSANFEDTILDDEASQSINDGEGPFAGSYRPEGSLAALKTKNVLGTWTLEVTDDWSVNRAGTLNSWSLIVETEVQEPLPAPVIHVRQSVPGGIFDTVYWDDAGAAKEHQSAVAVPIPDKGTVTATLVVEDAGLIDDLNVKLDITHGLDSDLDVFLIAPDGTRVELFTDVGGLGDNFADTILDSDADLPLTEGSAPFAGTYRPEGNLSDLVGKDVHGTWTLEVTDDSALSSGTLNHWSVIVDVSDTLYCAECATDAGFATVIADSGWITGKSHTFTDLDPNQEHWYRVKARPMEMWSQTSESDFATDTLTHTQTTSDGNVVLAGGGGDGLGPKVSVIQDPSFETLDPWWGYRTNPDIVVGAVKNTIWATDGQWAGCVVYFYESFYNKGNYGYLWQPVNWTGVSTLRFDYASIFFGSCLKASVLIGDVEIWSANGTDGFVTPHLDVTVDVSAFSGTQPLVFKAEALVTGRFDSGIAWDNLRTYGPGGHDPSGTVVSTAISIGAEDTWDLLRFNATAPTGTTLTVDVLPATGSTPIEPWRNIPSAGDGVAAMGLSDLADRTIRLGANLSTSNPSVTPALHDWSLTYSDAARQSAWSNVESSVPPK